MSLIHEALEKAKLEQNKKRPLKNEGKFLKRNRVTKGPLMFLVIIMLLGALALLLDFVFQKSPLFTLIGRKYQISHVVSDSVSKADDINSLTHDTIPPVDFHSEYNKFMASGDMDRVASLILQFPDSINLDIAKDVLGKLIDFDDFDNLEKVVNVLDVRGFIVSPLLYRLGEYYEKKGNLKASGFYLREYLSGNPNPLLLAKAATIYDKLGFPDSALKYYELFLVKGDSGELYSQIKRRYIYLAERRKEDAKIR